MTEKPQKNDIGIIKCPYCGVDTPLRESKKGKSYFNCPAGCGQFFARNARADKLLRDAATGNAAPPDVEDVTKKTEEKTEHGKGLADRGVERKKGKGWGTVLD